MKLSHMVKFTFQYETIGTSQYKSVLNYIITSDFTMLLIQKHSLYKFNKTIV